MNRELINRLRQAALVAEGWDYEITSPPVGDWVRLMEEAADALAVWEDDVLEEEAPSPEASQTVE